jgi:hypothetical protein
MTKLFLALGLILGIVAMPSQSFALPSLPCGP